MDVPESSPDASMKASVKRVPSTMRLILILISWYLLWGLTPGLLANGVGTWFFSDYPAVILTESLVVLAISVPLFLLHQRFNRMLFARNKLIWLYAIPIAAGVVLPFHYGLILPLGIYMFWTAVSVFWQDYLTFGVLQSYMRERFPAWLAVLLVAALFWSGHALFIPDRFGPVHVIPSLAIFVLGVTLALLRTRPRSLHVILALHLTFYYAFA